MTITRTVTTEGAQTVITEIDSTKPAGSNLTRWTLAPGQVAKHELDASVKSAIDAAAQPVQDAIAATVAALPKL